MDTCERSAPDEPAASKLHPRTAAAWARSIFGPEPIARRTRGGRTIFVSAHIPESVIRDARDAWAAQHPAEARWRLGWPARCDAAALGSWRALPAAERARRTDEAARYWAEVDAARAREEAAARRAEMERIAAERAKHAGREGKGASVEDRARAWLGYRGGKDSKEAFGACVALVRGFMLDEGTAFEMMLNEYVPRFHRALPRAELMGMVRRAARSNKPAGFLLNEDRR